MTTRLRLIIAGALAVILLGGAIAYAVVAISNYQARISAPSGVSTTTAAKASDAPRVVFRNTATGAGYGLIASVPLGDPTGTRTVSDIPCDRVYQTTKFTTCLRIDRGVVTTFGAYLLDNDGKQLDKWGLPGLPSRTRISPDSRLASYTAFITGEAYATVGFSVGTHIVSTAGKDYGDLESFTFTVDGSPITSTDRNFWGVTFTDDDNIFYATGATNGKTWLVKGDLAARTLTAIHETAECPSISPDGKLIAYKKNVSTTASPFWNIAVLTLATGVEKILPEKRSIDDQVDWLNDSTLLYGVPRDSTAGDSDIWSIPANGSAAPKVYIDHAWSPSVVN
ncbi:hypothetical protein [Lacisediminihabitans changchengi]|uniref:TolB-like translocation protein n=1 Tax=Lacisediminihabitans changchengi TaxID=2787634 RepID=A0A934SN81_9MICO|nr:hypothetical protein [Lacisediminihabitans changchengi]MBK4348506.1 hypothetical protein [Lacisediminihabitans changchengi]